jgi:hypothetical protein
VLLSRPADVAMIFTRIMHDWPGARVTPMQEFWALAKLSSPVLAF